MICKKYFAKVDSLGFPIPGTMMGFDKDPCKEGLVELTAIPQEAIPGLKQCFHPGKLRFFYQVDKRGKVVPNSLTMTNKALCGSFVEFKKFIPDTSTEEVVAQALAADDSEEPLLTA